MNFFYATTTISVGNGKKTPFWEVPWLNGIKQEDNIPLLEDNVPLFWHPRGIRVVSIRLFA
jgi:hypothetical protein